MSGLRDRLIEFLDEESLFLGDGDEFDRAIIGTTVRDGNTVVVYDVDLVIECLMNQGMDREEAEEWYGFNIECAYMGPYTPIYVRSISGLPL